MTTKSTREPALTHAITFTVEELQLVRIALVSEIYQVPRGSVLREKWTALDVRIKEIISKCEDYENSPLSKRKANP